MMYDVQKNNRLNGKNSLFRSRDGRSEKEKVRKNNIQKPRLNDTPTEAQRVVTRQKNAFSSPCPHTDVNSWD